MNSKKKKLIYHVIGLIGIAGLFGHALKLYLIWFTAYVNHNEVIIQINNYNEAIPELFFFPITLTMGFIGMYCYFELMLEEKKQIKAS